MTKVFIGVGHGGIDSGAVGNGFKEKDLNLAIAQHCYNFLIANGITVMMSRTKDENDDLKEEIAECNAFNPDVAVEIHNNAGGGDGAEVFYTHDRADSKKLASDVLNAIIALGQNSRGLKIKLRADGDDYFGWVRQVKAPAALVECAFIDTKDIEIIDTPEEQKAMGIAIAKGILNYLGIAVKNESTTEIKIEPTIKVGDVVKIAWSAKYYTGAYIPMWVKLKKWVVKSISGDRIVIDKSEDGKNAICSPISSKYLTVVKSSSTPSQTPKKSITEIAEEVINGKWGNGADRKSKLEAAGYNYNEVQKKVNELLSGKTTTTPAKKSIDEIAREVIAGKWGNGADRKKRLEAAGYSYNEVQTRVNALLKNK